MLLNIPQYIGKSPCQSIIQPPNVNSVEAEKPLLYSYMMAGLGLGVSILCIIDSVPQFPDLFICLSFLFWFLVIRNTLSHTLRTNTQASFVSRPAPLAPITFMEH